MELKLKNGERVLLAKVIAKKEGEGEGKVAGRKVLVKCQYSSFNSETRKDELVHEWIAFWNGSEGSPQLYTAMSTVPLNASIIVHVNNPEEGKDLAALKFISGPGILSACKGSDCEVNVIVGKMHKASKKIDDNNFNAVIPTEAGKSKIWHQIAFKNGKNNPTIVSFLEKAMSYDGDMIFVTGKGSSFENKKDAFTYTGYKIEKYPVLKEAEKKQPETKSQPEKTVKEEDIDPDKIVITIGMHKNDNPVLSSLKSEADLSWLGVVNEYYTARNDSEKKQLAAIKKYLGKTA